MNRMPASTSTISWRVKSPVRLSISTGNLEMAISATLLGARIEPLPRSTLALTSESDPRFVFGLGRIGVGPGAGTARARATSAAVRPGIVAWRSSASLTQFVAAALARFGRPEENDALNLRIRAKRWWAGWEHCSATDQRRSACSSRLIELDRRLVEPVTPIGKCATGGVLVFSFGR